MHLRSLLFLLCSDPSLGRVAKDSFSQQTLLELLISGLTTNKERICGNTSELKDISEWNHVYFTAPGEVIAILWSSLALEGTVELKWIPPTVLEVTFAMNRISGTADLTCLPDGLQTLALSTNRLEGRIDLTKLPESMTKLYLGYNNFVGKVDFSQLPKSLTYLVVSHTQLEGEVYAFDGLLSLGNSNVKDMRNNQQ